MEDIDKKMDKIFARIQIMQDCISLHLSAEKLNSDDLVKLKSMLEPLNVLLTTVEDIVENYETQIESRYKKQMAMIEERKNMILNVLIASKKRNMNEQSIENILPSLSTVLSVRNRDDMVTPESRRVVSYNETPATLSLLDYQRSPFISKIRPVALKFTDFEANITNLKFNEIPKYMRGRETFEELHQFLEHVIIPCFTEKYQLLYRKRECIRLPRDLELWKLYRTQESYFPHQKFITQGDVSRKMGKMIDKKAERRITMLRHLGILQELREKSTACYIWLH